MSEVEIETLVTRVNYMSGVPENPMEDTQIMNLLLFCLKYINSLFNLAQIVTISFQPI